VSEQEEFYDIDELCGMKQSDIIEQQAAEIAALRDELYELKIICHVIEGEDADRLDQLATQKATPEDLQRIKNVFSNVTIIGSKDAEIAALREQLTKVRMEAIGWMYSYACNEMDCDRDIRFIEVPEIIDQALIDLGEAGE